MSAGIVLVVAGIWIVTQVLGGDALDRLGITGGSSDQSSTVTPDPNFRVVPPGTPGTVPGSGGGLQDVPPGYNGLPNGGNF